MSLEKLITISSDDKDSDSQSNRNFFVTLRETYYTQGINKILIKEVTIPNCFYNISNGIGNGKLNNQIIYNIGGSDLSLYLLEGQYNIDQFISALTALFLSVGIVVIITQDEISQKLIFQFTINLSIKICPMSNVLGLTNPLICLAGVPIKTHYPPDLSGVNAVNIHSTIIAESNGIDGNSGLINLMERVSLHDIPFGSFGYKMNSDTELASISYAQPKNLSRVDIRLRDGSGNILDIGTKKMSVVLKCYFA